jgi:hypothetical protein
MRTLLLLPLLLVFAPQVQKPVSQNSSLAVVSFRWSRTRRIPERFDAAKNTLTPEMIPANKNYARNVRVNDPAGAKDPNEDTIDGRSAALERNVQTARAPETKPVDGFAYLVRVRNLDTRAIEILFWEYQFVDAANPGTVTRRQFLCGVNIKPDKEKDVQAFSLSGPGDVVKAGSLANETENSIQGKAVINRVEYADGSIWQRKDWNFSEIRMTYKRAVAAPWGSEMCRVL